MPIIIGEGGVRALILPHRMSSSLARHTLLRPSDAGHQIIRPPLSAPP
jgi:hypothetical protein